MRFFPVWCLLLTATASHAQQPLPASLSAALSTPIALAASPSLEYEPIDLGLSIESSHALWLEAIDDGSEKPSRVQQVAMMQVPAQLDVSGIQSVDASQFSGSFAARPGRFDIGLDLYSAPEFENGLIVFGDDVAMKFGGYVKTDFIYDFDPIDSTDSFVTTKIPVGSPDRTNTRFHARQTRLSFDTRWKAEGYTVQAFVEGDFFGENSQFRLRHAYGEVGSLLVGRTWTTFTDVAASPATIDFEGSVSNVNRRQAQARWTQPIFGDALTISIAVEDTRFIVIAPPGLPGDARSPSPDVIARLKLTRDWGRFQFAYLSRTGGYQPTGGPVMEGSAWGLNFTGVVMLLESTKVYYQIVHGEGIGSYRSLPDAAPESATTERVLPLFGWMVGITHEWNDRFSSNFTYAANQLDTAPLQPPDDVSATSYLAANLIWSPLERVKVGIEYLYGTRENVNMSSADAHRIQSAVAFILP
ncbi:DcaP family trimeric outer membrane transporter [Novipirellula herctigrandis]